MIFQIHMWVGAGVSAYVLLMSISGSIIVWQNELSKSASIAWLVKAHDNLLSRSNGRFVNGLGGICLVSL
jgi:uncharacterized iron-regulated membrane protein